VEQRELSQQTKDWMRSIDPLNEHGFAVRQPQYWLIETPENELERLEMNQAIYEQCLLNKTRFPDEVNKERLAEYRRIQELKGVVSVRENI